MGGAETTHLKIDAIGMEKVCATVNVCGDGAARIEGENNMTTMTDEKANASATKTRVVTTQMGDSKAVELGRIGAAITSVGAAVGSSEGGGGGRRRFLKHGRARNERGRRKGGRHGHRCHHERRHPARA